MCVVYYSQGFLSEMHFISSDSCSFTSEFFQPKTKPEPKVEQRTQILSDQFLPHRFK